ncbi:conserved hypothetical protein [Cupriavidus taiwanensis]|nr:conserved hypothetical protein [Cupriavidus taiwanensis]
MPDGHRSSNRPTPLSTNSGRRPGLLGSDHGQRFPADGSRRAQRSRAADCHGGGRADDVQRNVGGDGDFRGGCASCFRCTGRARVQGNIGGGRVDLDPARQRPGGPRGVHRDSGGGRNAPFRDDVGLMAGSAMAGFGRADMPCTPAELLHRIRAMLKQLSFDEASAAKTEASGIERRLATRLSQAIAVGSALEIAVVLGCGAELSLFPDDAVLERCTTTVRTAGQCTLVGAIWAVRHRCVRGGGAVRRFSL